MLKLYRGVESLNCIPFLILHKGGEYVKTFTILGLVTLCLIAILSIGARASDLTLGLDGIRAGSLISLDKETKGDIRAFASLPIITYKYEDKTIANFSIGGSLESEVIGMVSVNALNLATLIPKLESPVIEKMSLEIGGYVAYNVNTQNWDKGISVSILKISF